MKKQIIIFIFLLNSFLLKAQENFKTVIPPKPVVSGESFQVQYVILDAVKIENFKAPVFASFRFVSGPNQYTGSVTTSKNIKPVRNFVFTLEAVKPGRFTIPGAFAEVNGKPVRSKDELLEVISKEEAAKLSDKKSGDAGPGFVLRPGEDPYEMISQNLFLKLEVDRTHCFAGEPVLAIFKLYSRLESSSDIIKNPGFYGFTVHDMVNLTNKQIHSEIVNGNLFVVHTFRKVQLYPLQAGTFTIDPMEIKNKVEFSQSRVNKKTEQEIVEGITGNDQEDAGNENTEVFENSMHTEPVLIRVKPVPDKNRPAAFDGAVGIFAITASTGKTRLGKNEEGIFEITISGHGNFTQLNTPALSWPAGIEGFEPVVIDSLDKTQFPLAGSRTFRYVFICNRPGLYQLPSVNFSFFDPGNNTYKTVSSNPTRIEISNEEKKNIITAAKKESIADKNARASRVAVFIVILLVIFVLAYWIRQKNKPDPAVNKELPAPKSIDEILSTVTDLTGVSNKEFCNKLHQVIWKYLGDRFKLEGTAANKEILFSRLKQQGAGESSISMLQKILSDCEMGMFTGAALDTEKEKLLADAKESLEAINESLF
jgi:hypothetical protein